MVKDDLRSIGHAGEAGRGNKAVSPSAAARSLAVGAKQGTKPAATKSAGAESAAKETAKKAASKTAASSVKKTAAKPATKKAAAKPVTKRAGAKSTVADSSSSKAASKTTATTDSSATKKSVGSTKSTTSRRSHLRAVPDPDANKSAQADARTTNAFSASTKSSDQAKAKTKPSEIPEQPTFSLDEVLTAVFEGAQRVLGADWERQLATIVANLRRRMSGDYQIDEFGLDPQVLEILNAAVGPIAEKWFRLEVRGIENIPTDGGALLVANHSGTIPVDGLVTGYAVHKYTGRNMRALGADLVFKLPVVGELARKSGATLACAQDAERLLTSGELAAVWPEGFKGVGKPFSERYKLQRFGRGGFVSSAMRAQVPIVPVSIVGAEEIYPLVGNIPSLARLFGFPYLPITPFFPLLGPLGLIPLPSKWIIEFGEPVRTDAYAPESADDPMLLFNVTDQVRESIQETLYRLLVERGNPFS